MAKQIVFYGPNLEKINDAYSLERFKKAVSSNEMPEVVTFMPQNEAASFNNLPPYSPVPGKAKGRLLGGNLTALCSLLGTKFEPDFSNCVLFLEEHGERTDTIDRWFNSLELASKLDGLKAITFSLSNCTSKGLANALPLDELLGSKLIELKLPSCFGMPFYTNGKCATVPLGLEVEFDAVIGTLSF